MLGLRKKSLREQRNSLNYQTWSRHTVSATNPDMQLCTSDIIPATWHIMGHELALQLSISKESPLTKIQVLGHCKASYSKPHIRVQIKKKKHLVRTVRSF